MVESSPEEEFSELVPDEVLLVALWPPVELAPDVLLIEEFPLVSDEASSDEVLSEEVSPPVEELSLPETVELEFSSLLPVSLLVLVGPQAAQQKSSTKVKIKAKNFLIFMFYSLFSLFVSFFITLSLYLNLHFLKWHNVLKKCLFVF